MYKVEIESNKTCDKEEPKNLNKEKVDKNVAIVVCRHQLMREREKKIVNFFYVSKQEHHRKG